MIILYSDNDQGTLFLKTDQLDGETDWKLRKAVKMTQTQIKNSEDYFSLYNPSFKSEVKYFSRYLEPLMDRSIILQDSSATVNQI